MTMEDHLGIVYLVDNAQQFWSELEDILKLPDDTPTLSLLDSTLKRFLTLCASYHEQYLQSAMQLEHACNLLLDSELFLFHSERMCEILVGDAQLITDPHYQLIFYHVFLNHGRRRADFFRSHKRWRPLIPLLMDHVLVEIDPDTEDTYLGTNNSSAGRPITHSAAVPIPIEAKLRVLGVRLLYDVCRVQKLSVQDLRIFDDSFIDHLFDLVEQTRDMHDETFNYSVIKLIVALNEQFMVSSLSSPNTEGQSSVYQTTAHPAASKNRVLVVLMRRLGSTKTFGENMIFMLNRAGHTPEDLCMQLLVLKLLYLLFTTTGTSEYFYTNDLCVLVDVFLRELVDLDEDSESLRHTYLRVLHPLLTKTQLRNTPYKRPQIVWALESVIQNPSIRDINPTTKRLVERCLSGEWCVQLRKHHKEIGKRIDSSRRSSPSVDSESSQSNLGSSGFTASTELARSHSGKTKTLKSSKSVENIKGSSSSQQRQPRAATDDPRRPSNASALSLSGVACATPPSPPPFVAQPKRRGTANLHVGGTFEQHHLPQSHPHRHNDSQPHQGSHHPLPSASSLPPSPSYHGNGAAQVPPRKSAPPAPPKRRKPPAIPVGRTNGGATITTIKASATSPLAKVSKSPGPQHNTLL